MLSGRGLRGVLALSFAVGALATIGQEDRAHAQSATTIGGIWEDGMDTRRSANDVAHAVNRVGYRTSSYLSGRSAQDAWGDARGTAVYGLFGHANGGQIQVGEGVTDASDQIIKAGKIDTLDTSVGNVHYWKDYVPYLDVDFMKVAILAGCYTARRDPNDGDFTTMGPKMGMDAVLGFIDFVYYPSGCVSCTYSGNYLWSRFAVYVEQGDTLQVAISKSVSDLEASEGDDAGWASWYFGGSVDEPEDVRLAPRDDGEGFTSQPAGLDARAAGPGSKVERPVQVGAKNYRDYRFASGLAHRREADTGRLVWLQRAAKQRGRIRVSKRAARRAARTRAASEVPWFVGSRKRLVSNMSVRHGKGERIQRFVWRLMSNRALGPGMVKIEVDRRAGRVTSFSASRVRPRSRSFEVPRKAAIARARRAVGSRGKVTARRDVWKSSRWVVTINRGRRGGFPDIVKVMIDGQTGHTLSISKT